MMIRHERVREAHLALTAKAPLKHWPLLWVDYDLWPAERDWLMHHAAYAAKWPKLMADPTFAPPPASNAEQASSQATALWKGQWLMSHVAAVQPRVLDLTAGSGIDTWGFEQAGAWVTAVEPDAHLAELLVWNGRSSNRVVCAGRAEDQEFEASTFDAVYVDPSRRGPAHVRLPLDDLGAPNPLDQLAAWRRWGHEVVLKLSPMLDANQVARWFPDSVELIYLSLRREVKEIVIRISRAPEGPRRVRAIVVDDEGHELLRWTTDAAAIPRRAESVGTHLYDPDPALTASRGAASWAAHHGLEALHPDSRLYTSDHWQPLPACRAFKVVRVSSSPPTGLRAASVVCRAFPARADALRQRLRLVEDAEHFLFATRLAGKPRNLFIEATRLA